MDIYPHHLDDIDLNADQWMALKPMLQWGDPLVLTTVLDRCGLRVALMCLDAHNEYEFNKNGQFDRSRHTAPYDFPPEIRKLAIDYIQMMQISPHTAPLPQELEVLIGYNSTDNTSDELHDAFSAVIERHLTSMRPELAATFSAMGCLNDNGDFWPIPNLDMTAKAVRMSISNPYKAPIMDIPMTRDDYLKAQVEAETPQSIAIESAVNKAQSALAKVLFNKLNQWSDERAMNRTINGAAQ